MNAGNMRDDIRRSRTTLGFAIGMIVGMVCAILLLDMLDLDFSPPTGVNMPVYIVPAGYAFVIWGFIYVGLLAYGIFQARRDQRANPRLRAASSWFNLSCVFNVLWFTGVISQQLWLTIICMFGMLFCLVAISKALGIARIQVPTREIWMTRVPISLYFGWITAATPINTTTFLQSIGFEGLGIAPDIWSLILLVVAMTIAILVFFSRYANVIYLLVIVWAFIGIAVSNTSGGSPLVFWTALIGAGAVLITVFVARMNGYARI
ncbi:MAG: hypothetical protein AAFW00_04810 [Bacteroidota bacterium]